MAIYDVTSCFDHDLAKCFSVSLSPRSPHDTPKREDAQRSLEQRIAEENLRQEEIRQAEAGGLAQQLRQIGVSIIRVPGCQRHTPAISLGCVSSNSA